MTSLMWAATGGGERERDDETLDCRVAGFFRITKEAEEVKNSTVNEYIFHKLDRGVSGEGGILLYEHLNIREHKGDL